MKAAVLYYSHKGKTAGYAREITMYLWSKGLNVSLSSVSDAVRKNCQTVISLFPDAGPVDGLWLDSTPQALEGFQPANSWTCKSRTYAFLYHL